MKLERLVGIFVILIALCAALFIFYPNSQESKAFNDEISKSYPLDNFNQDTISDSKQFDEFTESDFELYVYRAHVLSSKENAERLKVQIYNGGMPSFVEVFNEKQNLFAVYVGPFLSKNDILNNMKVIQKLSESDEGEIFSWNP